jgi:hypothetical protein
MNRRCSGCRSQPVHIDEDLADVVEVYPLMTYKTLQFCPIYAIESD